MPTVPVKAADVMTQHLAVADPSSHVMDAIERLIAQRVSGLPVLNDRGELVGRFSERTAIAALDLSAISRKSRVAACLDGVTAADIMDRAGLVLRDCQDVFDSATHLLARRVSGAPVVSADGSLLGVFSEQSVMHVFIGLCWEQLPSSQVTAWLDRHDDRRISECTSLNEILERFQNTPYRRLMVVHGPKLVGTISRWHALQAALSRTREPLAESRLRGGEIQMGIKTRVSDWMQKETASTHADADVLSIAQQFLRTGARQLPVLDGRRLDGQISRSDLLKAVQRFFPGQSSSGTGMQPLYLSSVDKRDVSSVLG